MNPAESTNRPPKRVKTDHTQSPLGTTPRKGNASKSKYRSAAISASGIHSGDVGIFVTSDKGQERRCLQELSDLLEEVFDDDPGSRPPEAALDVQRNKDDEGDIEADIHAELNSMRSERGPQNGQSQKLSLITLDIPCVSFVRFPNNSRLDPVEIVRKLCLSASSTEGAGPRSRYVRRLTPVTLIRKTLNDGLQSLCDQVLPKHFLIDVNPEDDKQSSGSDGEYKHPPYKFAIRPTIRNNNKIDRDRVIRLVADKVASLGQGKHSVDLKGYDKLVLVDVYRNVVGMSVVGSEYETLKKFNLAEIHASHYGNGDKDSANGES
ncbi:uncharacterized protein Z519_10228 [Cladophialophora bantiana CBS 173.52]|uniref:THUMP domain-containing protein n=1 Tax=Cladophialophora bantiana (strain ATCC 10958 / CBS 173.52 / CDC B-1940 / NIH 8579) TaxID=1442370 RepID=A0A0D2HXS9_CLAB1|nr:uncharacterized protein Z519_10228 [Cladophialophora bantiana CBS 173.52]KIW89374.1 hypothetical protein Z519_10228 [Cladophialophora bantiana CBS 173.52]